LNKNLPNNTLELELLSRGYKRIIGIDEVGRGAFAGPVYVAGFVYSIATPYIEGVKDSKKLTLKKRTELFSKLSDLEYVIKIGSVELINNFGIGKTIENLISEITFEQNSSETFFLIDGYFKTVFGGGGGDGDGSNILQIKNGDNLHYSISCASIIAKVLRDRYMNELSFQYPQYGFDKNVGYGTATHINALRTYGITELHRRSFRPITQLLQLNEQTLTRKQS